MELSGVMTDGHGGATKNPKNSVTKKWFFDVQWSDCPVEIEELVSSLWSKYELGNDNYILKTSPLDCRETLTGSKFVWGPTKEEQLGWVEHELDGNLLADFLVGKGVGEEEDVIIHWWW